MLIGGKGLCRSEDKIQRINKHSPRTIFCIRIFFSIFESFKSLNSLCEKI